MADNWENDLRPEYRGELISALDDARGLDLELPELSGVPSGSLREQVKALVVTGHQRFYSRAFKPALLSYKRAAQILEDLSPAPVMELNVRLYLADTYLELSNFKKAKEELIEVLNNIIVNNRPISPRMLWLKMAKTWLAQGDSLYREFSNTLTFEQKDLIREEYNQILLNGANPNPGSPLYSSSLEFISSEIERTVLAIDDEDNARLAEIHPEMVELIYKCRQRFEQLDQDYNFIGFESSYVPILRFDYLQGVARTFAQVAAQANREYINYMQKVQQGSFTIRQLQQAIELNRAGVDVEEIALEAANLEIANAALSENLAEKRWTIAKEYANYYRNVGRENVRLEQAISWANANAISREDQIRLQYTNLEDIGIVNRAQARSDLISELSRARATRNYELQLRQLEDRAAELAASRNVAKGQIRTSTRRRNIARLRSRAAQFRVQHSEAKLKAVRQREIGLEFFSEMARLVRDTAQIYLEHATLLAYMMQQAYNFELGKSLNRIRIDYGDLDNSQGLYAADLLLGDIDYFTFHKTIQSQNKVQPVIDGILLSQEYPLEFLKLLETGQMLFSTRLEDFHRKHPGMCNARIISVFVKPVGSIPKTGPIGSLTVNGVSRFRNSQGEIISKMHASETLLISSYNSRRDTVFAPLQNEQLGIFENIGLEADWLLSFPKSQNAFDFKKLAEVQMFIAYFCEVEPRLVDRDLRTIPQEDELEIHFDLQGTFPGSIAELEELGKCQFEIIEELVNGRDPRIRGLQLIAIDANLNFVALNARLWSQEYGDENKLYEANENKIVVIQSEEQEDAFYNTSLATRWSLELRPDENPDLRSRDDSEQQLDLGNIQGIFIVARYLAQFALQTS